MHASTVAIDLAKEVFELAFADDRGRVLERKRLSRRAFARALVSSDTQFHALRRHPDLRTPGRVEDQFRAVPRVASRSLSL